MGIHGKISQLIPVFKQFVEGGKLAAEEQKELDGISWMKWNNYVNGSKSFLDRSHQVRGDS